MKATYNGTLETSVKVEQSFLWNIPITQTWTEELEFGNNTADATFTDILRRSGE